MVTSAASYINTTNAAGTFNTSSVGYVQGTMLDDPAVRFQLAGGVLGSSETLPMWGGVGINETITPNGSGLVPVGNLGGFITRATSISATGAAGGLTGFSVYNQNYSSITTTSSPAPLSYSGMQVNIVRLGSNARIVVAASAALVSLETGSIAQQVSWDFVNQQLIPYQAAYASASVQSATYTSATGVLAVTFASAPAGATPTVGATFSISGMTTSAGSASAVNGDFPLVSSGSAGAVLNFNIGAGLGTITINSATGTLAAGGGAVPCKVLSIETANSMVVNYNAATGVATWNYNSTIAIIELTSFSA